MATIKNCTDIEQSRKLAEILPLESADMYYKYVLPKSNKINHIPEIGNPKEALEWYNKGYTHFGKEPLSLKEYCITCWSLTALLDVLPKGTRLLKSTTDDTYHCDCPKENIDKWFDNPVDACMAMIEKLNELNLL